MLERMKKYLWVWVSAAILVLAAGSIAVLSLLGIVDLLPGGGMAVTPTVGTAALVEPDSEFIITGVGALEEAALREKIALFPEQRFSLLAETDKDGRPAFRLKTQKPLPAGEDFTLVLAGKPHMWPVAKTLLVTRTMPMPDGTGVSVATGVEFAFNGDMTLTALENAFTITPPVEGVFVQGNSRMVFSPKGKGAMDYETTYTVTLSDTLQSRDGWKLREPYTFSFTTISLSMEEKAGLFTLSGNSPVYNTLTSELPQVDIFFAKEALVGGQPPELAVTLYKFSDVTDFTAQVETAYGASGYDAANNYRPNTEGLTEAASFTAQPTIFNSDEQSGGGSLLQFPEKLPEGRYLAKMSYDTGETSNGKPLLVTRYLLVQSSDLSVFFMHTGKDLLLWVNDAATGQPVEGATFDMNGDIGTTITTGKDGTALITNADSLFVKEWEQAGIFTIQAGDRTLVDGRFFDKEYQYGLPEQTYISYLFTDRPLYQTTDTIQVWGMVRARRDGVKLPDDLTLMLEGVDPVKVTPDGKGFFTATLDLKSIGGSTWGNLQLMTGEQELNRLSLRIFDFVKPIYTSDAQPVQPVYLLLPGQPAPKVQMDVSLFDGTPVPGFRAKLDAEYRKENVTFPSDVLVADAKGHMDASVTMSENESTNTWRPQQYSFSFVNFDAEIENYMSSGYLNVIHRDLMLESKLTRGEKTSSIKIDTHRVDISKIKSADQVYDYDLLRGEALSVPVTAQLTKVSYKRELKDSSYDYINMVSVPNYRYERVETLEKTYTLTTQNGSVVLPDLPQGNRDDATSYYLTLVAQDSQGRRVESIVWITPQWYRSGGDSVTRYSLERVLDTSKMTMQINEDGEPYYPDEWFLRSRFDDGETVQLALTNNEVPVEQMTGRMLWATVQTGFENVTVTDQKQVSLPFSEDLLPNYTLAGAYFDGKHIFLLSESSMYFNDATRALDVALDTGREEYAPGDPVNLTATVTQATDGKPAGDAQVVVAVVDEAIFAIREQYPNLPSSLYTYVFYPSITKYASYRGPGYNGPGEKGGGGDDNPIREKFQDTAFFATGRTDASGKVKMDFTLPDNITSWRMTSLAITDKNWAGYTTQNITATRPFYVVPMVSGTQLAGDDLTIGLRSAGRAVTQSNQVSYTVTLENSQQQPQTVTAGLREYGWAVFPGLPAGDYTVVIRGECMGFNDTVRLPVSVIPVGLEAAQVKTMDLKKPLTINPLRYPVMMTVYDKNQVIYNQVVRNLMNTSYYSQRADMRIARSYLYNAMTQDDQPWYGLGEKEDLSDLKNAVMKVLPYSTEDWDLTAKMYLAMPEMFSVKESSMQYWVNEGSSMGQHEGATGSESSFMILRALMGEYTPIDPMSADGTYVEQINYATAAALQGDVKLAQSAYDKLVTPNLKTLEGVSGEVANYIPTQGASTEKDSTAAALRLAIVLEQKDADPLMRYLLQKQSRYDPYIGEQLLYLTRHKAASGGASISYTLDGKAVTQTLSESVTLPPLSKNQLESLKIQVTSGEAYADLYYTAAATDADVTQKKIPVIKTITPVDSSEFKVGGLVKITITPDLSAFDKGIGEGEIYIDDYLPTSMKFEREGERTGDNKDWWLASRQTQRLRFAAQAQSGKFKAIVYYARCAAPGSYKVEGSYVSSGASAVWGSSDAWNLTILP